MIPHSWWEQYIWLMYLLKINLIGTNLTIRKLEVLSVWRHKVSDWLVIQLMRAVTGSPLIGWLVQWCKCDSSSILSRVTWGFDLSSPWWPPLCHHRCTHSLLSSSSPISLVHSGLFGITKPRGGEQFLCVCLSQWWVLPDNHYSFTYFLFLTPCAGPVKRLERIHCGTHSCWRILIHTSISKQSVNIKLVVRLSLIQLISSLSVKPKDLF